jgi:hypothetical protein
VIRFFRKIRVTQIRAIRFFRKIRVTQIRVIRFFRKIRVTQIRVIRFFRKIRVPIVVQMSNLHSFLNEFLMFAYRFITACYPGFCARI